jgi:hypothetical protein
MFAIRIFRVSAVGAVAIFALAGFMTSASASTTPAHLTARHASLSMVTAKPNSKIIGSGKKVNYSPKSLKVTWSGPKEKKCTAAKEAFTITNSTKVTQTVTSGGKALGAIAAGKSDGVCAWGKGTATGVLGLKANKKAKLTLHIS